MRELEVISRADTRQAQIEALDIGDCIAIASRHYLESGMPEGTITKENARLRNVADQQCWRAHQKDKQKSFSIEVGRWISSKGWLHMAVVITREL